MATLEVAGNPLAHSPETIWSYEAVGLDGKRIKKTVKAVSQMAAAEQLIADGLTPIAIKEVETSGLNMDLGQVLKRRGTDKGPKMKLREVADFTRQLYQMLNAGLSQNESLRLLAADTSPEQADMCEDLADRIQAGESLSDAMARYPRSFDEVYRSYIASGETTGSLAETVGKLSQLMNRRMELRNKIVQASAYPVIVGLVVLVLVSVIMGFVVPTFAKMYTDMGATLPLPTRVVIKISELLVPVKFLKLGPLPLPIPHLVSPTFWLGLIGTTGSFWLKRNIHRPEVGTRVDRIRFKLPLLGKLARLTAQYRWANTLAGALSAGVSAYEALGLAARASCRWQQAVLPELQDAITSGQKLSDALNRHPDLIPARVRGMIATGEATGELPTMLESVAQSLHSDIDAVVNTLGAKLEVLLISALGVIVGGIVLCLYMPIFGMADALGGSSGQF